jgi:cytochrome d ubiquinol oxidase subunit II
MFPGMIISSLDPAWTITAFNGSSSQLTLTIMLGVALVFVPIVICYQFWMYRTFAGPVTREHLKDEHSY